MSEYEPGLDAIIRTDRFVDALADGARMSSVDPLSAMLGGWRDDVRSRPDDQVVTLAQASAALAAAQKPSRSGRFGLTVVGAAAAAVLGLGGFGAVVYDAAPGDALYGLRTMLFGESAKNRDDAVVLAAQTELSQVHQLVQQAKWDEAQEKLVTLGPTVLSVNDAQSQQQLVDQFNTLAVKVIERDAQATLPPPGEPMAVLPSSPLTLLPPPVIEATTTTLPSIPTTSSTPVPVLIAPTSTGPLPTATGPLPTPTEPSPTATGPLPTPTGPLPTATGPLPTPTVPLPTATATVPTPPATVPKPTVTVPAPTMTVPTASPAPPPAPPITVTSPAAQAPPPPPVGPPAASPAPTTAPTQQTSVVTTVTSSSQAPQGPRVR